MPTVEFELSDEQFLELEACAERELREVNAQAKVFVLEALKLWPVKAQPKASAKPKTAIPKRAPAVPSSSDGSVSHAL
jgi:hypothetical protein